MTGVHHLLTGVKPRRTEEVDLDKLYAEGLKAKSKEPLYKTVATFAGLTGRKLWLRDGSTAMTDGHEIQAPLSDPYAYQLVEHELAHILFQSNGPAKLAFIVGYVQQVNNWLVRNALPPLDPEQVSNLKELINSVIGVIEDVRIESLWGVLYAGSKTIMDEMHREHIRPLVKNAHRSLASFLIVASTGVTIPPGRYDRFRPALEEAMQKVERRGFTATLLVSKWLLQKLVDEVVHRRQGIRQDPAAQKRARSLAAKALQQPQDGEPGAAPQAQSEPVEATLEQRYGALNELAEEDDTASALIARADDWKQPKYPKREEAEQGEKMAKAALQLKTGDAEMEQFLAHSEEKMRVRLEELRVALSQQMEVDGWITKNTFGKVNMKDVRGSSTHLKPHDMFTVNRLRSIFYRLMGRRKTTLQESGSSIDVLAYIQSKITNQFMPCFTQDERGRGFKVLVLIDRSSSMEGEKTQQAERACKVLAKALDFPFVDFHVWGFQSLEDGELDLVRFDKRSLAFTTETAKVGGHTPLHLALRVGVRFMDLGAESKQIIIITDGWPSFATKKGDFSTKTLTRFVREEVLRARRVGMNVTGVVIGDDMKNSGLNYMLGSPAYWKRMTSGQLGEGLVRVVTSSFTKYLRSG